MDTGTVVSDDTTSMQSYPMMNHTNGMTADEAAAFAMAVKTMTKNLLGKITKLELQLLEKEKENKRLMAHINDFLKLEEQFTDQAKSTGSSSTRTANVIATNSSSSSSSSSSNKSNSSRGTKRARV